MRNILYILFILPFLASGQTDSQNYITSSIYRDSTLVSDLTKAQVNITYVDGLGRPIQKVAGKMSATAKDIITPIAYDGYGRPAKEFLPYASTNTNLAFDAGAATNIISYYTSVSTQNPLLYPQDTMSNPYTEKFFESSPLGRVLKQGSSGAAWKGHSGSNDNDHAVKYVYTTNVANEVKKLSATATSTSYDVSFVSSGYYSAGMLYKTVTKDENWTSGNNNTIEEFKNNEGKLILKRTYNGGIAHDTYYVYDQFGNLAYVLPPLANGTVTSPELIYQYKYDKRNRVVEKKIPSKQTEFIVYDPLDRQVRTGPVNNPFSDGTGFGWIMTVYDVFGRVAFTGWYPSTSVTAAARTSLQGTITSTLIAQRGTSTVDGVAIGYNAVTLPTGFKLLTVNYYDNYTWPGAPALSQPIENQAILSNPKGQPTGLWTRILGVSTGTDKELTYMYYDKKGRTIRNQTNNYLTGYTQNDTKVDFDGTPLYTINRHKRVSGGTELTTRDDFSYSLQDRLISHTHKINDLSAMPLATNTYNELGQLINKAVGYYQPTLSVPGPVQTVDYKYNTRGWLTDINDVNNLGSDLFAFKISYNKVIDATNGILNIKPLYNGNISETYWRSKSDNVLRKYSYTYDDLSRLTYSYYQKPGAEVVNTGSYNENMRYDKNGNIIGISRTGGVDDASTAVQIDDLTMLYTAGTNQLTNVYDNSTSPQGFKDTNTSNNVEYTYDGNGNMLTDGNKSINGIKYNHLNLPTEINFVGGNKITYLYNAAGKKVKKTVVEDGTTIYVDYLDGFQYKGSVLQFFPTTEGYVDVTTIAGTTTYNYVYQYKDHLGNVRESYAVSTARGLTTVAIKEENHYYPFGLKHLNYNMDYLEYQDIEGDIVLYPPVSSTGKLPNNYKFQEQERQEELGLGWDSFKWRNYDYALGRFMSVDPLSEQYNYQSTYAFAGNEPLVGKELEGLENESSKRMEARTPTPVAMPQNSSLQPMPNKNNVSVDSNYLVQRTGDIIEKVSDNTYDDFKTDGAGSLEVTHAEINTSLINNANMAFQGKSLITAGELDDSFDDDDFSVQFTVEILSVDKEIQRPSNDFSGSTSASTTSGGSTTNSLAGNASVSGNVDSSGKLSGGSTIGGTKTSSTTTSSSGTTDNNVSQNKMGVYEVTYQVAIKYIHDQDTYGVGGSTGETDVQRTEPATGMLVSPVPLNVTNP